MAPAKDAPALERVSHTIKDMVIANVVTLFIAYAMIWLLILFKTMSEDLAIAAGERESPELAFASKRARTAWIAGVVEFIGSLALLVVVFPVVLNLYPMPIGNPQAMLIRLLSWLMVFFWIGIVLTVISLVRVRASMKAWMVLRSWFMRSVHGPASTTGANGTGQLVKAERCRLGMLVLAVFLLVSVLALLGSLVPAVLDPYGPYALFIFMLMVTGIISLVLLVSFIAWLVFLFTGLSTASKAFAVVGNDLLHASTAPPAPSRRCCTWCGMDLPGDHDARFCPGCGASLQDT